MSRGTNPVRLLLVMAITLFAAFKGIEWIRATEAPPDRPSGTASVTGVVLDARGEPVPDALVMGNLQSGGRQGWHTVSDEAGRYAITDLPAGRFTIVARKDGHLGQAGFRSNAGAIQIALSEGQIEMDVSLLLPRASAISGRVLRADGSPARGTFVRALRIEQHLDGKRLVEPLPITPVAGNGRYEIASLPAGDYFVVASLDPEERVRVYHPDQASLSQATPIRIAPGEHRQEVDLQARDVPRAPIRGRVIDASGNGVQAKLDLSWSGMGGLDSQRRLHATTDAQGRFQFDGVAADGYWLSARATASDAPAPETSGRALRQVETDGLSPVEVTLVLEPGFAIAGRVTVGDGDPEPPGGVSAAARAVVLFGLDDRARAALDGGALQSPVSQDGAFSFEGLPAGQYRVSFMPRRGFRIQEIRDGTTDRPADGPLTVSPESPRHDVIAALTTRPNRLGGRTQNAAGEPLSGHLVVVFPDDPDLWNTRPGQGRIDIRRADSLGRFTFEGLLPGRYRVAAVAAKPGDSFQVDRPLLEALRPQGMSVDVAADTATDSLELTAPAVGDK